MRITVDPNTDSSGFGHVAAGQYRLRIKSCEQKMKQGGEFPYLAWNLEFADPNVQAADGKSKVGSIFDNTTLKPGSNSQFALKRICDAAGVAWGDFDTENMIGLELNANVIVGKDNKGEPRNEIGRYIPLA